MPPETQEAPNELQQHADPEAPPSNDHDAETGRPLDEKAQGEAPGDETQSVPEPDEAHPLDPDGKRFKQVWARAKTAEQTADALKQELQKEREERIRFEERLKAQDAAKTAVNQPEYTWQQLEAFIDEGKITRAQAQDYREKLVEQRAIDAAEKRLEAKLKTTSSESTILTELERYKKAVPEVEQAGTPEFQKAQREYVYLTQRLGYPPTYQTQLVAARAALGDIDSVERTAQTRRTSHVKEPYMETQSSGGRPVSRSKDPITTLSVVEKAHYEKMIKNGRYNGWDDVWAELAYVPPSLKPKRR